MLSGDDPTLSQISHEKDFAVALDSRPPSFFETHVKNLWLGTSVSDEQASRVLSICTGVRNLALLKLLLDVSHLTKLPLRSLDTRDYILHDFSKLRQILPDLTYLSVLCYLPVEERPIPDLDPEWLPALTHVQLELVGYTPMIPVNIRAALKTSSLQSILVRLHNTSPRPYSQAHMEAWAEEDPKVTIKDVPLNENKFRDWEEKCI